MDLNFEIFMVILLVVSILVVGNFLRDGSSNYLEGALLVVCILTGHIFSTVLMESLQIVYIIIALTAYYYPNPHVTSSNGRAAEGH